MREIKFRAWVPSEKRMYKCLGIEFYPDGKLYSVSVDESGSLKRIFVEECPVIVMQYTGLKDKNGKEIYEGDIVGNIADFIGIIEYEENYGRFMIRNKNLLPDRSYYVYDLVKEEGFSDDENSFCANEIKIIGNIYENPEILKGQN
jgi:uncharacterized phage protein (TIGR01671 family)